MRVVSVALVEETLRHLDPNCLDTIDLAALVVAFSTLRNEVYNPGTFAWHVQDYLIRRDACRRAELDDAIRAAHNTFESSAEWPYFVQAVDAAWKAVCDLQGFAKSVSIFPHEVATSAMMMWSPWPDKHLNPQIFGTWNCSFYWFIDSRGSSECIQTSVTLSNASTTIQLNVRMNRLTGAIITDTVEIVEPDPRSWRPSPLTDTRGIMALVIARAVGATIIDVPSSSETMDEIRDRVVKIIPAAA